MIETIVLGIVQGLTEFLPISSSGHLAILEYFLGVTEPVVLTVALHFGTLIAIIVFFFRSILAIIVGTFRGERESITYILKIVIGTIPIVVLGIIFESWVEQLFYDLKAVALLLGMTGFIVILTGCVKKQERRVNYLSALLIGLGQMFAILPGISRSGMTISAGLFSGVEPDEAFRFSFLLSLPAVLGANILELKNLSRVDNFSFLLVGVGFSFVFGLLALKILRRLVQRNFYLFGPYCLIISVAMLFLLAWKRP